MVVKGHMVPDHIRSLGNFGLHISDPDCCMIWPGLWLCHLHPCQNMILNNQTTHSMYSNRNL